MASSDVSKAAPAATVRDRLAHAAFELFAAQGYDGTTVDDITRRAQVSRRTFFRYFPSKEDVIFPDHDAVLERVAWYLASSANAPALQSVSEAARLIFESFMARPEEALARYHLTRQVPTLRDREVATVARYERVFSDYLRGRLADQPDAALASHVIAASIVAAHNHVLREWLRSSCQLSPRPLLDDALARVGTLMAPLLETG